jgi:hypothetical protein
MRAGAQRRRTKQEIKQQKLQEEQKLQEVEAKMANYDKMQRDVYEQAALVAEGKELWDK